MGQEDTRVLEFHEGIGSRPLLREADTQERRISGTSIEVILDRDPYEPGGLLKSLAPRIPQLPLKELCAWLCPTFPVTILAKEGDGVWETAVSANDWIALPALDLLNRIEKVEIDLKGQVARYREQRARRLRPVYGPDGSVVGRLAFRTSDRETSYMLNDPAAVCVGGSRADSLDDLSGVIAGTSKRASRDSAAPIIGKEEFERWLKEQATLLEEEALDPEQKSSLTPHLVAARLPTGNLPIAFTSSGWINALELRKRIVALDEVIIVSDNSFSLISDNRRIELLDSVLVCDSTYYRTFVYLIADGGEPLTQQEEMWDYSVRDMIHGIIAEEWEMNEEEIEKTLEESDDEKSFEAIIGRDEYGNPVRDDHVDLYHRSAN